MQVISKIDVVRFLKVGKIFGSFLKSFLPRCSVPSSMVLDLDYTTYEAFLNPMPSCTLTNKHSISVDGTQATIIFKAP